MAPDRVHQGKSGYRRQGESVKSSEMRLHALHIFILRLRDFVFCSNYDIKNHLSQASGLFFINKKALLVWKTSNACFSVQSKRGCGAYTGGKPALSC
jgi:hypothetical protein